MTDIANEWTVDLLQRSAILHAQPCFASLTNEETDILAGFLQEHTYNPEERIVREGDPVDSVYFIVKGNADVRHVRYADGKPQIESLATLKEGNTIGLNDQGFYSLTGRRTATVVANTEMLVLRLSVAVFHGFSLVNPHVSRVMREHAARMLGIR
jgi:signal-transduction protein with cAMP-binding, CBS, and nucleotidyltransferase domain